MWERYYPQVLDLVTSYFKSYYRLWIWAAWIILLVELLSRTHLGEMVNWTIFYIPALLLNIFVVGCLLLCMIAITGKGRLSYWIVALLVISLSLISGIKLKILGIPLLPWDFALASEGTDMAQYLKNTLNPEIIIGVLCFLIGSYFLLHRKVYHFPKMVWEKKMMVAAISTLFIIFVYSDLPIPVKSWLNVHNMPWNQGDNVRANGFVLTTLMNFDELTIGKSDNYDKEAVIAFAKMPPQTFAGKTITPNVIIILGEAFWDPTQIKGISFSQDPIPFIHSLQEKYSSGTILSPQYGGGTANVELEVLTGISMRFLPQGSIAYNQYINHSVDSLASIFARSNYTSTAISPYHNWFFNSSKVYRNFGFSKFIPIEFFNPIYDGPYIADNEVAKNIIETTIRSEGPDFVFANTMENHFHFYPGKFEKNTIDVFGTTGTSQGMLETLAQGINHTDKMLQKVVEYFQALAEPTIVVFFGDHLPFLGDNYDVFKDTQYINGTEDPDFLNKMYRTPVVVWNNYLPEHKHKIDLSPSFLGPYILNLAQIQGTYYTDFLRELSARIPVIPPKNYYSSYHISEKDLEMYESLQYDILFGDQTGYGSWKNKIIDPKFQLGYEPMKINQITPGKLSEKATSSVSLLISGDYFPPQSLVYLNDKRLLTIWESETSLRATLPVELTKAGKWKINAKIIDSKENIIAQSNSIVLTITK